MSRPPALFGPTLIGSLCLVAVGLLSAAPASIWALAAGAALLGLVVLVSIARFIG